jgi:hypothetical protein
MPITKAGKSYKGHARETVNNIIILCRDSHFTRSIVYPSHNTSLRTRHVPYIRIG